MKRDNRDGSHARRVREPPITSRYYIRLLNLSKLLKDVIQNRLVRGESRVILDLGCGEKPYQPLFDGKYSSYIGLDITPSSLADVVACGEHLPLKDVSFDVCLCTLTYEHLVDPEQVTREIHRILKKDGVLLATAPGVIRVHNYPSDYWRWTDQGLRLMLGKHFSDISVHEVTTPLETIFQLALTYLPNNKLSSLCTVLINKFSKFLAKDSLNKDLPKLIGNYLVVVRKE